MTISRKRPPASTAQRKLLFQLLCEANGHLTARELYRRAMERDASVSLATVYRTLRLFKEEGIIDEMRFGGCTCSQYERAGTDRHHHMLCKECGRLLEFDTPSIARLVAEVEQGCGFKVTDARIALEGYCSECAEKREQDAKG